MDRKKPFERFLKMDALSSYFWGLMHFSLFEFLGFYCDILSSGYRNRKF